MSNDAGYEPAFPVPELASYYGMTLRDWFAGQAMAAFIARETMNGSDTAQTAYAFADAMLAERLKR